ncbi:hypothetical protein HY628_02045 [Candidatus Uhrbacteria bacterium]|nr:hypothetical protein [Candidatus Uhrbacteria bacterium]
MAEEKERKMIALVISCLVILAGLATAFLLLGTRSSGGRRRRLIEDPLDELEAAPVETVRDPTTRRRVVAAAAAPAAAAAEAKAAPAKAETEEEARRLRIWKKRGGDRLFVFFKNRQRAAAALVDQENTLVCRAMADVMHRCGKEGTKYGAILFRGRWHVVPICAFSAFAAREANSPIHFFASEVEAEEFASKKEAAFKASKARLTEAAEAKESGEEAVAPVEAKPEPPAEKSVVTPKLRVAGDDWARVAEPKPEPPEPAEPTRPNGGDPGAANTEEEVKADDGAQVGPKAKRKGKKPFRNGQGGGGGGGGKAKAETETEADASATPVVVADAATQTRLDRLAGKGRVFNNGLAGLAGLANAE